MQLRAFLVGILVLLVIAALPVSCPREGSRRISRRLHREITPTSDGDESSSAASDDADSPFEELPQSRPARRRRRGRRSSVQESRQAPSPPTSPPPEPATCTTSTSQRRLGRGNEVALPNVLRQARRVLQQEPLSEDVNTHEVWGVLLEAPECLDALNLSFTTWSVGLRRNAAQGAQPPPLPTPILGGARASLLQVGRSFFSIPGAVREAVSWRFVSTRPTRRGSSRCFREPSLLEHHPVSGTAGDPTTRGRTRVS